MHHKFKTARDMEIYRKQIEEERTPDKNIIRLCTGGGCIASGAMDIQKEAG